MQISEQVREAGATGRVSAGAARVYEQFFVPALFAQWVTRTLDAVAPLPGNTLLDVGTGTGVVARAAPARVGGAGSVVAVDPNTDMLTVAAEQAPGVTLVRAGAENLPFGDDEFDCVTCQFALMFVPDRAGAIDEIARVTRPGGRIAVSTWAAVAESPGYAAMVELLGEAIGEWAAEALRAPFALGTADVLAEVLRPALPGVTVQRYEGVARFGSLEQWLHTDIRGWTLADHIDDDQFARLRRQAARRLQDFVDEAGRVVFPAPALFATATAG